jgi:hypothetical protein
MEMIHWAAVAHVDLKKVPNQYHPRVLSIEPPICGLLDVKSSTLEAIPPSHHFDFLLC